MFNQEYAQIIANLPHEYNTTHRLQEMKKRIATGKQRLIAKLEAPTLVA